MDTAEQRKLLMLCYHYAPAVSGGVGRSVRYARYLPELGWSPTVITTDRYGRGPGMSGEEVVRVGELFRRRDYRGGSAASARGPTRGGAIAWAEKWLLIPDKHVRWTTMAFIPAMRIVRRGGADTIYTTSPPASAHVLGGALKALTGKPWIMDLRDPWTIEPLNWYLRTAGPRLAIEKRIELSCFRRADAIVTSTPEAALRYAEIYPSFAGKIHSIPNGYDERELEEARATVSNSELLARVGDSPFVISHVGTFCRHTEADAYPRGFLDALSGLVREGVIGPRTCTIVFAGALSPETERRVAAYGLGELIARPGPVSHIEALRIMHRSDLLLLYDPNPSGDYYVHGKLYEYLAARRPILGVLPPGAARRLLESSGHAIAVTEDDAGHIRAALLAALGARGREVRSDFDISQYEGRHCASRLAGILDTMGR
jgi:glycosyltransferase involved in cell wall biosynthesis